MAVKELIEARWKAIIGAVVTLAAVVALASTYELVNGLLTGTVAKQLGAAQGQINALLKGGYDIYIWSQWYSKNAPECFGVLAAIMGAGLISSEVSKGTIFFLLSKPVSRTRVLLTKYGVNALVLLGVMALSSVAVLVASMVRGQPVHWAGVAVSTLLLWLGMLFILGLAMLFSVLFKDVLRPLIGALLAAILLSIPGLIPGWNDWNLTGYWSSPSAYLGQEFPARALAICLVAAIIPVVVAIPLFRKQAY